MNLSIRLEPPGRSIVTGFCLLWALIQPGQSFGALDPAPQVLIVLDTSSAMNSPAISGSPQPTRLTVASAAVLSLVKAWPEVRFGLVRSSARSHLVCETGTLVVPIPDTPDTAATVAAFEAALSPALLGEGPRDLEGAFMAARAEWERAIRADPARGCRTRATVLITSSGYSEVSCSIRNLVTQAKTFYSLPSSLGASGVIKTWVVGLSLTGESLDYRLEDTAEAGQGYLYPEYVDYVGVGPFWANDPDSFQLLLSKPINDVSKGEWGNTPPVLSPDGGHLYEATNEIPSASYGPAWAGHLRDYPVDASGIVLPARADAATRFQAMTAASRMIYTGTLSDTSASMGLLAFSTTTADFFIEDLELKTGSGYAGDNVDCDALGGGGSLADAQALVRFVRGDTDIRYRGCLLRRESSKLLEPLASTPVLALGSALLSQDPDYVDFLETEAGHDELLLLASNAGMLHAFRATTIEAGARVPSDLAEVWAYVPRFSLEALRLRWASTPRPPTLVATPVVRDVRVTSALETIPGYRRVAVMGNQRQGNEADCEVEAPSSSVCGGYVALDLTPRGQEPVAPLWEFVGEGDILEAAAPPVFGRVRIAGIPGQAHELKSVVFLAGRGRSDQGRAAPVYVLEVGTGEVLARLELPWHREGTRHGISARPVALDRDGDLLVDTLLIGDREGYAWKVDLSDPNPRVWESPEARQILLDPQALGLPLLPIVRGLTAVGSIEGALTLYVVLGDENSLRAGEAMELHAYQMDPENGLEGRWLDEADGDWPVILDPAMEVTGELVVFRGVLYLTVYQPGTACDLGQGYLVALDAMTGSNRLPLARTTSDRVAARALGPGRPSGVVLGKGRWYVTLRNGNSRQTVSGGLEAPNGPDPALLNSPRVYAWLEPG